MGFFAEQGSFTVPTGTSPFTVPIGADHDEPVRALILYTAARSSDGTGNHLISGYGVAVNEPVILGNGYQQGAVGYMDRNNQNPSQVSAGELINSCLYVPNSDAGSPSTRVAMSATDFGANSITFECSTRDSNACEVFYLALGGDDITHAGVTEVTTPGGTGTSDHLAFDSTGSFQPTMIFAISSGVSGLFSNASDVTPSVGAAVSSTERYCLSGRMRDAQSPTITDHLIRSDRVIHNIGASGASADLSTMLSTGFRLNWSTVGNGATHHVLCLAGPRFKIGGFNSPTSAGDSSTTGVGFPPDALILFGHGENTAVGTTGNTNINSFGVATSGAQASVSERSGTGAASSNTRRGMRSDRVLHRYNNSGAVIDEAQLDSFDSDGFTLNWLIAPGSAGRYAYLAIAEDLSQEVEPEGLDVTVELGEPLVAGPVIPEGLAVSVRMGEPVVTGGLSKPDQVPKPVWTMVLADYDGVNVTEILDAQDRRFHFHLTKPNTVMFKVPMPNTAIMDLLEQQEGLIKLYRQDQLAMTAEITSLEMVGGVNERSLAVVATETMWPRLRKRLIGKSIEGYVVSTATDKGQVMADTLDIINAEDDTGLDAHVHSSSTTVTGGPWRYKPWTELLLELSQTINGFEWWQEPRDPSDAGLTGHIHMGLFVANGTAYDTLAETVAEEAIFEYGAGRVNLREYRWLISTENLLNQGWSVPADYPNSGGLDVVEATDATSITDRGLREEVIPNDLVDADLRQDLVDEHVAIRKVPRQQFMVQPHTPDGTGRVPEFMEDYTVGSVVEARVNDTGLVILDAQVRVYGAEVALDSNGQEQITLTVVDEAP